MTTRFHTVHRTARCVRGVAALLIMMGLLLGCETIAADLNDAGTGLFAHTPSQAAIMAMDPHNPENRRRGVLLLSNAPFGGNPPYLALYREYVENESDPLVKAVSIRALAKHGEPADAMLIAPYLEDENLQVRWETAKGLQRLHEPRVVPLMLGVLQFPDEASDVRVALATALGQYPEDRVFQGLVAALDARELSVNVAASRSLETLTGQSLGLDRQHWYAWYDHAEGDRFADRSEFLYPTYHRNQSFLERLAFWSSPIVEHPAPPAGLRPLSERRTYDEESSDDVAQ